MDTIRWFYLISLLFALPHPLQGSTAEEIQDRRAAYEQLQKDVAARPVHNLEDLIAVKVATLFPLPFFKSDYLSREELRTQFIQLVRYFTNELIPSFRALRPAIAGSNLPLLKDKIAEVRAQLKAPLEQPLFRSFSKETAYNEINHYALLILSYAETRAFELENTIALNRQEFAQEMEKQNFSYWNSEERSLLRHALNAGFNPVLPFHWPSLYASALAEQSRILAARAEQREKKIAASLLQKNAEENQRSQEEKIKEQKKQQRLLHQQQQEKERVQKLLEEKEKKDRETQQKKIAEEMAAENSKAFAAKMKEMGFSWWESDDQRALLRDQLKKFFNPRVPFDWDKLWQLAVTRRDILAAAERDYRAKEQVKGAAESGAALQPTVPKEKKPSPRYRWRAFVGDARRTPRTN